MVEPKNPQHNVIQLVTVEKNQLVLNGTSLKKLQSFEGDLCVVSIAGKQRTGKCFLLNKLL